MKPPKERTNITENACLLISQLSPEGRSRKSHQLIQVASAASHDRLAPGKWLNILDTLVHRGFLSVDRERMELLITERGRRFLEEGGELWADIEQPPPVLPPEVQPCFDETLYEKLRWKRKILAEQEGVPVYRIFSNRALAEMAAYRPETIEAFNSLNGVGDHLSARYGQTFLTAIRYYLRSVA